MRRAYTLIEIIITIAITGILAIGTFKALEAITVRSEKAKTLTTLSIDSQSALDQISLLLYERTPMSLSGCTNATDCVTLDDLTVGKTILQWYGTASESYKKGDFSGFVDLAPSVTSKPLLQSPGTDLDSVLVTEQEKWGAAFSLSDLTLSFAGTFEEGESNVTYGIENAGTGALRLSGTLPSKIYEKYYLADTAYAVTRKASVASLGCTNIPSSLDDNALLLFYDYRPWKGENFCSNAKVSILAAHVNAFNARYLNGTIRLGIDMNQSVRGNPNPVRLSKQKVVF